VWGGGGMSHVWEDPREPKATPRQVAATLAGFLAVVGVALTVAWLVSAVRS
jgi:hypothetical protein